MGELVQSRAMPCTLALLDRNLAKPGAAVGLTVTAGEPKRRSAAYCCAG